MDDNYSSDEGNSNNLQTELLEGMPSVDGRPAESHDQSSMGCLYAEQSGSEGDVETDCNMDSHKRSKKDTHYCVDSSLSSLDEQGTNETNVDHSAAASNEVLSGTLPMQRGLHFNIPPPPHIHHNSPAPPSESSGNYSQNSFPHQRLGRDTDSDNNNATRSTGSGEYHLTTPSFSRMLLTRPNQMGEQFCIGCQDYQQQTLPQIQNSCCHSPATTWGQQNNQQHYHISRPNIGCTGAAYDPPWDMAYPYPHNMSILQHQGHPGVVPHTCHAGCSMHGTTTPCTENGHSSTCGHNSMQQHATIAQHPSLQHRNSIQKLSRTGSSQDGTQQGMNTLATTGSHSYETPWDVLPSERHGQPPPCSPPPPPPDTLRRPVLHYDGAALRQANTVQHLPQKKPPRRQCSWKCIAIFLMVAIIVLSACVATFTALLVKGKNAQQQISNGASSVSSHVTNGNLGDRHRSEIPPNSFVKVRFYVPQSQFYKFNLTLGDETMLGVYGRRSIQPTHTQFDFFEQISGKLIAADKTSTRTKRSVGDVNTGLVKYLDEGYWFVSLYNDGTKPEKVKFSASKYDQMDTDCPNDCNGKGTCKNGVCRCFTGYTGLECARTVCLILCSGNGVYEGGKCECFDSWKGAECNVRSHQCDSCSEHGHCLDGECVCDKGWRGETCEELACPSDNCSNHGICHQGYCYCELGYRGLDCSIDETKNFTIACSNDCTGHGTFKPILQTCECDLGWQGRNCEEKMCSIQCINGRCSNGRCACFDGWEGVTCNEKQCDNRCSLHGTCTNGTCQCMPGWNGKHCTLGGCPESCSDQGECTLVNKLWKCSCADGWKGRACDVAMELQCTDGQDNDGDNFSDCLDPDCCTDAACRTAAFCQPSVDPSAILLRKPKLSTMASFYESKRFLIDGDGDERTQKVSSQNSFEARRVSIIRGQVLLRDGSPALGTRVEIDEQPRSGFTLTRVDGMFDIMVNGGGSVTVKFIRGPSKPANVTMIIPWNKLYTLDPVTLLHVNDEPLPEPTCTAAHDRYTLHPVVLPTWQHSQLRACPSASAIIPESQVVQESIAIPGSDVHLVYKSSDTTGYRSTILIQLTPSIIPDDLELVHLKVCVEGVVYRQVFESDPNLTYRFSWNRQNAYEQNVYGIVTAQVSVGYVYKNCEVIHWDQQATTVSGFFTGDMSVSGSSSSQGWNLDIQHFYNYQEGILHKGDGTNVYLQEKPHQLVTVLGNGQTRQERCSTCDGSAADQKLLAPVALASDLDGAVYVADYNLIRKLSPGMRSIKSVLELSGSSTSYRYYMTVSPNDGMLYVTDLLNKQILKVKDTNPHSGLNIATNYEVVVGNGQACSRLDGNKCGDGGPAIDARLTNPKGIAVNKFGEIYFADDTTIRKIGLDGIIETVVGSQDMPGMYVPMPCGRGAELYEVFLVWPTSLAFSPVDGSLYILDTKASLVLKITPENKVVIVVGQPSHCDQVTVRKSGIGLLGDDVLQKTRARDTALVDPISMTFAPNGDLYIIESDEKMINRVRVVSTDGYISHYAGGKPPCSCGTTNCDCWDPKETVASKALFNKPTSMTVTPDGVVYLADMGNLRVHSIVTTLPASHRGLYSVVSPEEGQIYKFNRQGFHVQTRDIMTDKALYNFTMWPPNSLRGVLVNVTGIGGQIIAFTRDYASKLETIRLNDVEVAKVKVNQKGQLQRFQNLDNVTSEFKYKLSTGLMESKQTSRGETFVYEYDNTGRLHKVIMPAGELLRLDADVDSKGAVVTLRLNSVIAGSATSNGNSLSLRHGSKSADVTYSNDGSIVVEYLSGLVVTLETGSHPTMGSDTPTALKRKIISSSDGPVHRLEWRYYLRRNNPSRIGKKLRVRLASGTGDEMHDGYTFNTKDLMVNGENLLSFEYFFNSSVEIVRTDQDTNVITVRYNPSGLPVVFISNSSLHLVNVTYNQVGQMTNWRQGSYSEERRYSDQRQLISIKLSGTAETRYLYRSGGAMPTDIFLPSGIQYQLVYDDLGNIVRLVSPNGGRHQFSTAMDIGFVRHLYRPDTGGSIGLTYIEDYNSAGQLIRSIYPSSYRRVYRRYTVDGRPREILFDNQQIIYHYNSSSNSLTSVSLHHSQYDNRLVYKTNGSLYDEHKVEFTSKRDSVKFARAEFRYKYNRFLRIVNINGMIIDASQQLPVDLRYEYSEKTGHITKIDAFRVQRDFVRQLYQIKIMDDTAQIIMKYDSNNLLNTVDLKISDQTVYTSSIAYDNMRRIHSWTTQVGSQLQTTSYEYSSDSQIEMVSLNNGREYSYTYNAQGSLNRITSNQQTNVVGLDALERVTTYKSLTYQYDKDGFLISKGNLKYEYNSRGQLIQVLESGTINISYLYDAAGRLVQRKNNHGSTVQFFYANVMRPSQITHIYNMTSKLLQTLYYDSEGKLFALNTGETRYYVMCDPSGTPTILFDRDGSVVKKLDYTVFGELVHDSKANVHFYIGFQGGFFDSVTKLAWLSERWYNTELGRWMDASLDTVFSRALKLTENPVLINPYQYQQVTNLHLLDKDRMYMKDLRSWLIAMGYNLDVLAPKMNFEGEMVSPGMVVYPSHHALLPLVSAFQCAYEQDMVNFLELSVVPKSKLTASIKDDNKRSLTPSGTLFSAGVILSIHDGYLYASVLDRIPSQEDTLVSKVLNGSIALGLNYTLIDKVVHYLVKEEFSQLQDDLALLDVQAGNSISSLYLENGIQVKVERYQERDEVTNKLVSQANMWIIGNGTVISIRYGTTTEQERKRVFKLAFDHAKQYAWLREQNVIMNGRYSKYLWTSSEINELRRSGKVQEYSADLLKAPEDYPELAADPSNIIFRKSAR